MIPPGLNSISSPRSRGGVEDVVDVLQAEHAVVDVGREDPLGGHPDRLDALTGGDRDEVEQRVGRVGAEEVAVHVPGGRHVLDRAVGEQLARQLRLGPLVQQPVAHRDVDLERVAERDLARRARPIRAPAGS